MYEFKVEGMSCGHCVKAVTKSIQDIDGNARVEVDLANKKVWVESGAGMEAAKAAIVDAGYTVTESKSA